MATNKDRKERVELIRVIRNALTTGTRIDAAAQAFEALEALDWVFVTTIRCPNCNEWFTERNFPTTITHGSNTLLVCPGCEKTWYVGVGFEECEVLG